MVEESGGKCDTSVYSKQENCYFKPKSVTIDPELLFGREHISKGKK